jgi:hypothetical protein
MTILERILKK